MRRGRLLAVGAAVLLVAAVFTTDEGRERIFHLPRAERFYTRWVPPAPPDGAEGRQNPEVIAAPEIEDAPVSQVENDVAVSDEITQEEVEALARLGADIAGRLVWSSNRGGNHDLYLADLSTGSVRRLTSDPHVDYLSRFSPNGTQISFLRSRRPWVSFREEDAWDLYVMSADGSDERRLVEHAYHPTWTPDGAGLVFLRDNQIRHVDLASGRERVLQDGSSPPLEGRIANPEIDPRGRLSVTLRRRRQRVGVLDADRAVWAPVSDPGACHITWVPGEDRVLWVSNKGRGGTRIMHGHPGTVGGDVLIDLPGEQSHEYFPRVTNDGRWLVWGATAEGHEHDRADYEIFVWQLGKAWGTATRVTYSAANDQWPDLFVDRSSTDRAQ